MSQLYYKDALKRFKERTGGPSNDLKEHHKKMSKLIREVEDAIKDGKSTVPEIADAIDRPTKDVFFAVNALRRWGNIEITNKRGEFPTYGIKG